MNPELFTWYHDMEETSTLRPMSFGELYSNTWTLMRRTLPTAGILALLILVGVGMVQSFGTMGYLEAMAEAAATGGLKEGADPELATEAGTIVVKALLPFLLSSILNIVGIIFTMTMLTVAGWYAIHNENLSIKELLDETMGRPFWMALIQTIMLAFFMMVVVMIALIFVFGLGGSKAMMYLPYIAGLLALYPLIATSLRVHKIVAEDRGPWHGMISSIALVNSNIGRVFAALIVPTVIYYGFVTVVGLATGNDAAGFGMMNQDGADPESMAHLRDNFTWTTATVNILLTSVFTIFIAYLLTPIYVDLRARRGDFDPEIEEQYTAY